MTVWKTKAESKQNWHAYVRTVYTQSLADNNFQMYFKFTNSPNGFDAFEVEIQRLDKESTYLVVCLLSATLGWHVPWPKWDVPYLDPDSEYTVQNI